MASGGNNNHLNPHYHPTQSHNNQSLYPNYSQQQQQQQQQSQHQQNLINPRRGSFRTSNHPNLSPHLQTSYLPELKPIIVRTITVVESCYQHCMIY